MDKAIGIKISKYKDYDIDLLYNYFNYRAKHVFLLINTEAIVVMTIVKLMLFNINKFVYTVLCVVTIGGFTLNYLGFQSIDNICIPIVS